MEHFLLYTPAGDVVSVLVASVVVALLVWWAVTLAVLLVAVAAWRFGCALGGRLVAATSRRVYRPGGKA